MYEYHPSSKRNISCKNCTSALDKKTFKMDIKQTLLLWMCLLVNISAEVIETECHLLTLFEKFDNSSVHTATCECKESCGGSIKFNMTLQPSDIQSLTVVSSLYNSGNLQSYPKWLMATVEDHDVFNSKCRCGQYGDLSDYDKKYFELISYFFAVQVGTAFYFNIPIGKINVVGWVTATFNIFYPFFLSCALFNIVIMIRMAMNDSMSFLLQLFQFIASGFSVIFLPTWTFQLMLLYTNMDRTVLNIWYNFYVSVCTLWAQLLSLSLFLDRLFCIWKPLMYKTQATRKKAIQISLSLFMVSVVFASINLIALLVTDSDLILLISLIGYLSIAMIFLLTLLVQLIVLTSFLVLVKKRTNDLPEHFKARQRNLNRMMIGTGVTEMCLSTSHMLFNIFAGLMFLTIYYKSYNLAVSCASVLVYLLFYSPPLIGIGPFVSLLVCICVSKTYRKNCRSFFKCTGTVSPAPPTTESRLRSRSKT